MPWPGGRAASLAFHPTVRDPELRLPTPRGCGAEQGGPKPPAPACTPFPSRAAAGAYGVGTAPHSPLRRPPGLGTAPGADPPRIRHLLPWVLVGIYLRSKARIHISTFAEARACCEGEMQTPRNPSVVLLDLGPNPARP